MMSKPVYRREVQRSRRFAKEATIRRADPAGEPRANLAERVRAATERMMNAVSDCDFKAQFSGRF